MTEKILVGYDGSKPAKNALMYAIEEAKEKDLENITAVYSPEERDVKYDELLEQAEITGEDQGTEVETRFLKGDKSPDVEIVKFAEKEKFNHIIGSRGLTGISRVLLGSVAEGVVRKAHCAVTIARGECPP